MEIKRDAYLQQLIERKDNGMIKVITGIRRCGKSFLLFTIFKRYLLENGVDVDHIIEIALDGIENEELRDPKVCFKYIKDAMKDDGKYYLLLDEVQFMSRFEEVLNSLLRMSNIDVYVTGSNSKFLSSDIVTEFRGRGDEIRIYPLSFAEFYSVYDGDYDDAWDDYMIYGGLPQIVSFQKLKLLFLQAVSRKKQPTRFFRILKRLAAHPISKFFNYIHCSFIHSFKFIFLSYRPDADGYGSGLCRQTDILYYSQWDGNCKYIGYEMRNSGGEEKIL